MSDIELIRAIDGGTISFEDGKKPAEEYAPARKVRVEFTFSTFEQGTDEEADRIIRVVGDRAKAEVGRLLGVTQISQAAQTVEGQLAASVAATAPTTTRKRAPKVEEAASPPADTAGAPGADAKSPEAPAAEASPTAPGGGDEWGSPATEEIADKALTDAASKHSERLGALGDTNAVTRIRKLIGTFNPDETKQFSLTQLPQAQRADFLAKIAGLKAGEE